MATLAIAACTVQQDLGSRAFPVIGAEGGEGGDPGDGGVTPGTDGDVPARVDTGRDHRIVFVTVNLYLGDLRTEGGAATGLEGADKICNREAASAGIAGVFRAWLSTSTVAAKDRIAPVGPWKLVDGTTIFPGAAVAGAPQRYIQLDANGKRIFASNDPQVWTATGFDGLLLKGDTACADWTSAATSASSGVGSTVGSGGDWTDYGIGGTKVFCSARARLFCFEQ
ncbi:MAG: hypothetical protein JST00_42965 [Deltaproteobacteria bacterium]|nr:hypothetical protein [Deltaproteobacteria bacterium]